MTQVALVRELIVNATEDALNQALVKTRIAPEKIITVIFQPRRVLAIGDYEAKYRVIY